MTLNAEWHRRHPMPRKATLEERIRWHAEHQRQCGCRRMPKNIVAALSTQKPRPAGVR